MKKTLILFRGIPGAGKSTMATLLCPIVYSADQYFEKAGTYQFDATKLNQAHNWCQDQVGASMLADRPIIAVANTFTTEKEMAPYFELANKWGYQISTIIVENRHGSENIHRVQQESLEKMKSRFSVKLI